MSNITEKKYLDKINRLVFVFDGSKKKDFLKNNLHIVGTSTSTFSLYVSILRSIDNFESLANTSMDKFSPDLVDEFFYNFNSSSLTSLKPYLTVIKTYLVSTRNNEENLGVGYMRIIDMKASDLRKYVNKDSFRDKIITPNTMKEYVNCDKPYDCNSMAVGVLFWMGLNEDQIINLKTNDITISENNVVVSVDGNLFEAGSEFIDLFKKAIKQNEYIEYDDEGDVVAKYLFNMDSEYFVKQADNSKRDMLGTVSSAILRKRLFNVAISIGNKQFNMRNIIISKKIYTMLKSFNFQKLGYEAYRQYKLEVDPSIGLTNVTNFTNAMLEKLKNEGKR